MSHYSINYYQSQAIRSTMKLWWLQHLTGKGNSNLRRSMHLPSLFNGTILVSISAALSEGRSSGGLQDFGVKNQAKFEVEKGGLQRVKRVAIRLQLKKESRKVS
ncbi:uncharacterized protein LOC120092826 isoform X7 [Benincasa hispida]|uniref:uncharacterized protein LOC120092826 isoform X7 n=1 Tax=Benincasa hispida TaxID=102211 RepID=UPI001902132F|nr:uncharacterized protein LOC120092826 isoform X7 [Benincasa hispida]